jgi:hypothetical protein
MKEQLKSFLNEEQDPKAVEKVMTKLTDLLMKGEKVGYIGVQKKPVTVFPDSIVLTNRRIVICKPKNLGLSMDFTDYQWEDVAGIFFKENILGSEFSFSTKTDIQVSIDYIPKIQARKLHTYAKEQLELLKESTTKAEPVNISSHVTPPVETTAAHTEPYVEEVETEEVTDFRELAEQIVPVSQSGYRDEKQHPDGRAEGDAKERPLAELSSDELFEKLHNYKRLLDNGLILQGEYDALKREILNYM